MDAKFAEFWTAAGYFVAGFTCHAVLVAMAYWNRWRWYE